MSIDPESLEICLRVLAEAESLPPEHPDARRRPARHRRPLQDRQAAPPGRAPRGDPRQRRGRHRRHRHRRARAHRRRDPGPAAASRAPTGRQRRHPPAARAPATSASSRYTEVDAFYHQLCPPCAALQPRPPRRPHRPHAAAARCSPAAAPRSACTSRCGCCATAPTRRSRPASRATPCAASPRCPTAPTGSTGCASSASTCATPPRSSTLADAVAAQGPLDILINNAAQTVRRSPEAYAPLVAGRGGAAAAAGRCRRSLTLRRAAASRAQPALTDAGHAHWTPTPAGR